MPGPVHILKSLPAALTAVLLAPMMATAWVMTALLAPASLVAAEDSATVIRWRGVGPYLTLSCADTTTLAPWLQQRRQRPGVPGPIIRDWRPGPTRRDLLAGEPITIAAPDRPWWQALAVSAAGWSG
jgi:hypothetical protein